MTPSRVIVGVGMSSAATRDEVRGLVAGTLARAGLAFPPSAVATRSVFADDPRLRFGCPVVGFDDDLLVARSAPVERAIGLPARVAETAALLAAGDGMVRLAATDRSVHATVAVAVAVCTGEAHS